jgi:hypothetical protein
MTTLRCNAVLKNGGGSSTMITCPVLLALGANDLELGFQICSAERVQKTCLL